MTIALDPVPGWQRHAACRDLGPALFFPDHGNSAWSSKAKSICAGCVVRPMCLEAALTMENDEYGVFGGCSVTERATIRRQRKATA